MGIKDHVTNLRKRPEGEKKRIALAYSGAVTGMVFVVWLSVLLPRSYERTMGPSTTNLQASTFSAGQEIQKQYGDLEQEFKQAKEQFPEFSDPTAGGSSDINALMNGATSTETRTETQYNFGY